MESIDKKLRNFERVVITEAVKFRDNLLADIEQRKKEALKEIRDRYVKEAELIHEKGLEDVRKEERHIVSAAQNDAQTKLVQKRNDILNNVFDELVIKLREFVKTDDYTNYIHNRLNEAFMRGSALLAGSSIEVLIELTKADCDTFKDKVKVDIYDNLEIDFSTFTLS
jgi:vacuolar-type H+-ATPase subunit E/Vma4